MSVQFWGLVQNYRCGGGTGLWDTLYYHWRTLGIIYEQKTGATLYYGIDTVFRLNSQSEKQVTETLTLATEAVDTLP